MGGSGHPYRVLDSQGFAIVSRRPFPAATLYDIPPQRCSNDRLRRLSLLSLSFCFHFYSFCLCISRRLPGSQSRVVGRGGLVDGSSALERERLVVVSPARIVSSCLSRLRRGGRLAAEERVGHGCRFATLWAAGVTRRRRDARTASREWECIECMPPMRRANGHGHGLSARHTAFAAFLCVSAAKAPTAIRPTILSKSSSPRHTPQPYRH